MKVRHEDIHIIQNGLEYPFSAMVQTVHGKRMVVDAHYHDFIEILYCQKGKYMILLDGISHTFGAGDMVIINSNEVHYVQSLDEAENTYVVIRFDPELLYTTIQTVFEARYVLPFTMKTSTHQKVFCHHEIDTTPIPSLVMRILNEDEIQKYGFELAIRSYLGELFLWVLRSWHDKGMDLNLDSGLNNELMSRLVKVFNYVDQHYPEPIGMNDMADLCGMSYSYFSRFFKKYMNRNFSEYVNLVRVSKAEHLLATTDISITDVAMEVGFVTASYFIEQFKKNKGMTPKKFRNSFLKNSYAQ